MQKIQQSGRGDLVQLMQNVFRQLDKKIEKYCPAFVKDDNKDFENTFGKQAILVQRDCDCGGCDCCGCDCGGDACCCNVHCCDNDHCWESCVECDCCECARCCECGDCHCESHSGRRKPLRRKKKVEEEPDEDGKLI